MVWWQWLISLLCGLAGTAIGGYISYKTMLAQLINQREIEKEQHIRQKREDLYIKMCQVLMEHEKYSREHQWSKKCKEMYNELQGVILIYASKKIHDAYYELDTEICNGYIKMRNKNAIEKKSNDIADKVENFAAQMREELGIKGI